MNQSLTIEFDNWGLKIIIQYGLQTKTINCEITDK